MTVGWITVSTALVVIVPLVFSIATVMARLVTYLSANPFGDALTNFKNAAIGIIVGLVSVSGVVFVVISAMSLDRGGTTTQLYWACAVSVGIMVAISARFVSEAKDYRRLKRKYPLVGPAKLDEVIQGERTPLPEMCIFVLGAGAHATMTLALV